MADEITASILEAHDLARAWSEMASNYVRNAVSESHGVTTLNTDPIHGGPIAVPPDLIPNPHLADEIRALLEGDSGLIERTFDAEFRAFLLEYFPNLPHWVDAVKEGVDLLLAGGKVLPPEIEALILTNSKTRVTQTFVQQKQEVAQSFASRGFSMPPGALANMEMKLNEKLLQSITDTNNQIVIQQFKDGLENFRLGCQLAVKLREDAIQKGIDYLLARIKFIVDGALEKAKALAQVQSEFLRANQMYFQSLIENAKLALSYQQLGIQQHVQVGQINADSWMKSMDIASATSIKAAEALANMAGAALNSQGTLLAQQESTFKSSGA